MAAVARPPLAARPLPLYIPATISPLKTSRTPSASTKRPRTPDGLAEAREHNVIAKRARPSALLVSPATAAAAKENERKEKERRKAEREAREEEFRSKYSKAFPAWVFYFDTPIDATRELLEDGVLSLGGSVEEFFSREVTHLVTNETLSEEDDPGNKENVPKLAAMHRVGSVLRSPIKLKGRAADESLLKKAVGFNMKIWSNAKLQSVLNRCLAQESTVNHLNTGANANTTRSLNRLLESERLHGTTTERDPTQKRHDYTYFSKNSYFVLVEDMRQELATIAAFEYPISRSRDGREVGEWPILYLDPRARGPFIRYDQRAERKREKAEALKKEEKEREKEEAQRRKLRHAANARQADLRRTVSLNNLSRRASLPVPLGLRDETDMGEDIDSMPMANASGFLASTGTGNYVAASGNSVGITSTTGTTSAAGNMLRTQQLPAVLRERLQQQVVTSRRVGGEKGVMPPPAVLPKRHPLRKSRSTNTLRLPKREEGSKPGYCESCRLRFDDFQEHVRSKKHVKFANDDSNFLQLDYVLGRVQRRTKEEVEVDCAMHLASPDIARHPHELVQAPPDDLSP